MQNCKDCRHHTVIVAEGRDGKANLTRHEAVDCKHPDHGGNPRVTIDNDCSFYVKGSPLGVRPGTWYHNVTNSAHTGLLMNDVCVEITKEGEITQSGEVIGRVHIKQPLSFV